MPKPPRPIEQRYGWQSGAGAAGRYRDRATGRFVSELTVRRDLDKYIDAKNARLDSLTTQLRNREISLADWQAQMRNEIRTAHTNAGMVAKGGRKQMTTAERGRTGASLRRRMATTWSGASCTLLNVVRTASSMLAVDGNPSAHCQSLAQAFVAQTVSVLSSTPSGHDAKHPIDTLWIL